MANTVSIINLEQEEKLQTNDFVPVSNGTTTRKLNLYGSLLAKDMSNISELSKTGEDAIINTFLDILDIANEDSGFLLDRESEQNYLKTSLYSVNKKLPNNIILEDETIIDYTRDIRIDDFDVPVNLLGKEIKYHNNSISNSIMLSNITNIDQFDNYQGIKVFDYVKVMDGTPRLSSPAYYVFLGYDSQTGTIDNVKAPNFEDTTSWKYIGYTDSYAKISLHDILVEMANAQIRIDLNNIPMSRRREYDPIAKAFTGNVFSTLDTWVNSKTPDTRYVGLYDLTLSGVLSSKGNEPETITGLYSYNINEDKGDSRFARKTLNNLKPNGEEQLYDRTTDWGDNRFAHKALDNVKNADLTDVIPEEYDSSKDYGNSRFARKNLNNLRSGTYDVLNDKVPSQITVGESSSSFTTTMNFNFSSGTEKVELLFDKYTLNEIAKDATSFKLDYNYSMDTIHVELPIAVPNLLSGIIKSDQAKKLFDSLISYNGIDSEMTWQRYIDINNIANDGNGLTAAERDYYNKAWYKKIITDYDLKGSVNSFSQLPEGINIGDMYHLEDENEYVFWDGANWYREGEKRVYGKNQFYSDGNIVVTGYSIPIEAKYWNEEKQEVERGQSISERIEHLENLGTRLGTVDVNNTNLTYYKVNVDDQSSIQMIDSGNNYETNDIISVNTSVLAQNFYIKITDYAVEYSMSAPAGTPIMIFPAYGLLGITNGALYLTPKPLYEDDPANPKYKGTVARIADLPSSASSADEYYWVEVESKYYHYVNNEWVYLPEDSYLFSHKVHGGSGAGMTIRINAEEFATKLPTSIYDTRLDLPGLRWATINDYIDVRYDPSHGGVPARWKIGSITANGIINWEFDILLSQVERNFVDQPISYNELNNNAVHNNNILDGTIGSEKLNFSLEAITELYSQDNIKDNTGHYILGNVDLNQLKGNGTYIIRGATCSNSPVANTRLNWSADMLQRMNIDTSQYPTFTDTSKWYVNQYFVKNNSGAIIAGYQFARNIYHPGIQLTRSIIPPADEYGTVDGVFPEITSSDYRNWSWFYAMYQ